MKALTWFVVIMAVLVFLWWLLFYIGWGYEFSEGERTGDIYKFSYKGLFWKAWEGEMYLGGVSSDGNGALQVDKFYFSIPASEAVEKASLIQKIQTCTQTRNKHCSIVYKQWWKSPITIDSSYDVIDVIIN